jgi:2',3'-cyclic-nucleotide 2'-phosphodiesterase
VKILFIGDVVGAPGRQAIKTLVPILRARHQLQAVIANAENAAGGSGLTKNTADEILTAGVDVLTMGDHLWDQKEINQLLVDQPRLLRPINYPPGTVGRGSLVVTASNQVPIGVMNIQGRVFMPDLESPFLAIVSALAQLREQTKIILVDVHAEATSEKIALARLIDGKVSAVIGTHTHVQTADEQILPGGTAFLCDAGFTGPHESVLGREIEPVIRRFVTCLPCRFPVASGRVMLQGAVIDIDETTGKAVAIERLSEKMPS